jgi:RNA 2',3'-cyclic 3'-phosphodiesterase
MTRTFIALEMNETQQRHLAQMMQQVARALPSVRWADPTTTHLTLAFLGELDDEQLAQASNAAQAAAQSVPPFSYQLSRLGIFGSERQPRVIWVGIDDDSGALRHLHATLRFALERRGFALEDRPFTPHFTLARVKVPLILEEQRRLHNLLAGAQPDLVPGVNYFVQHIDLMKSELSRSGAKYTCLQSYTLERK